LRRVQRLLESVKKYNVDAIPVYVSVPPQDLALFQAHAKGLNVFLISDLDILSKNSNIDLEQFNSLPGNVAQQIVKQLYNEDRYYCRHFLTLRSIQP
jgi:hypothetical protein